ncbi:MAG: FG-GAP-like repeat-containing protein [Ardenticatenaceae bacterium]
MKTVKAQRVFAITLGASLLLLFTLFSGASLAYAHSVPFPTWYTLSRVFGGATWSEEEPIHRTSSFYDSLQSLGNADSNAVALGDVDSDGDLDAFVANGDQANTVWLNDGQARMSLGMSLGSSESTDVALGDLDGDLDAFVTNNQAQANKVWLNDGSGLFTDNGQSLGSLESWGVALEDLDGDDDLDAYVVNRGEGNKVWLNDGNALFTDSGQSLGNSSSVNVALGDLDGDSDLDAYVANVDAQTNKVWLNNGDGVFTDSRQGLGSSNSYGIGLGDMDNDGDLDAFIANLGFNKVWLNNGDGVFVDSLHHLGDLQSRSVALGDVDLDGDLDAFVTNTSAQINKVWLNNGDATFSNRGQNLGNSNSKDVALGDLDHNGALDAFVVNDSGNQLYQNGAEPVATATATSTPRATNTPTATPINATPTVIPDSGGSYEPNDSCSQASSISTEGIVQHHTFYTAGDVDWVAFSANAGTEYIVEALTPATSVADVVLEVYDRCNGGTVETQGFSFTPDIRLQFQAPSTGTYYLRLSNHDLDLAGENLNYDLSVRVVPDEASPGALILVAGRLRNNDNLQDNIHHTTNAVYQLFQEHGYDESRIHYFATDLKLNPDNNPATEDVDGLPSPKNLEYAITEWARDKVGPNRALTLYLMDHGDHDRLYLNGRSQTLTPSQLDSWLDRIEAAVPDLRVNVIVEACHSGSFIDLDQSVSQEGRVVMASTSANSLAYASEDGAVFSDALIESLSQGSSLYGAFQKASDAIQTAHYGQTPWLDDNGDSLPNTSDDGNEAGQRGFAFAGTFPASQWPPYIASAQIAEISNKESTITAEVRDDDGVVSVWAVIYKPSYLPPKVSEEMVQEILPTVQLQDLDGDGVYSGLYENFDEIGQYRIVIHALDTDEAQSQPQQITIQTGWALYLPMVIR